MALKKRTPAPRKTKSQVTASQKVENIKKQYGVIRNDILKLREDLQKGYDMTRDLVEKKSFFRQLIKAK